MSEVCFKIEDNYLYVDEELVEFDIPIFFICKDTDGQKYAVFCTDSDQLRYIICEVAIDDIIKMLKSEITLREFFLLDGYKWRVVAGDNYLSDEVETAHDFLEEELPVEGAFFELTNKRITKYLGHLLMESASSMVRTISIADRRKALVYCLNKVESEVHMSGSGFTMDINYKSNNITSRIDAICSRMKTQILWDNNGDNAFGLDEQFYSNIYSNSRREVVCYG